MKPPRTDQLAEHYESLDRETLVRQGADRLAGHGLLATRRAKLRLWTLAWIVIALVGATITGFYLWVLYQAKESGTKFSDLRNESFKVIGDDDGE